jgi:hypothetical protein
MDDRPWRRLGFANEIGGPKDASADARDFKE